MNYQVSRGGQTYGPYTSEDLQRYVASGNILSTDLAKSDEMPDWIPVSQILAGQVGLSSPVTPYAAPAAYDASAYQGGAVQPGYGQPAYGQPAYGQPAQANAALAASNYPDAPNLHWGLLILLTILTCGLGGLVYNIIVLVWLKKIQPNSKALLYFLVYVGIVVLNSIFGAALASGNGSAALGALRSLIGLAALVICYMGIFNERSSLLEHYNGPEPVGLQLSAVMTFFFSFIYFQYHLNRINEIKKSSRMMAGRPY